VPLVTLGTNANAGIKVNTEKNDENVIWWWDPRDQGEDWTPTIETVIKAETALKELKSKLLR